MYTPFLSYLLCAINLLGSTARVPILDMLLELSRDGRDCRDLDAREEIAAILIVVSIFPERQLYRMLLNIKIHNLNLKVNHRKAC
jgi:hypothetical protein